MSSSTGEALQALKAIEGLGGLTAKFVTAPSLTTIKSTAGILHSFTISKLSMPSLTIIDGSAYPGATIAEFNAGLPIGTYVLDVAFTTALSFQFTNIGQAPSVTVSYR